MFVMVERAVRQVDIEPEAWVLLCLNRLAQLSLSVQK